MLKFVHIKY